MFYTGSASCERQAHPEYGKRGEGVSIAASVQNQCLHFVHPVVPGGFIENGSITEYSAHYKSGELAA
jgi:hypothetical protein